MRRTCPTASRPEKPKRASYDGRVAKLLGRSLLFRFAASRGFRRHNTIAIVTTRQDGGKGVWRSNERNGPLAGRRCAFCFSLCGWRLDNADIPGCTGWMDAWMHGGRRTLLVISSGLLALLCFCFGPLLWVDSTPSSLVYFVSSVLLLSCFYFLSFFAFVVKVYYPYYNLIGIGQRRGRNPGMEEWREVAERGYIMEQIPADNNVWLGEREREIVCVHPDAHGFDVA